MHSKSQGALDSSTAKDAKVAGRYEDAIAHFKRGLEEVVDPNVPGVWGKQLMVEIDTGLSEATACADRARFDAGVSLRDASLSVSVGDAKHEVRRLLMKK